MIPEDTKVSTYCLVATCRLVVGSCVTATEVKPPNVRLEAPNEIAVVPTVTAEFVRLAFAMFVRVLLEPLMVLLVSVSVVSRPTNVVVASGNVTIRPAVETASSKVIALAAEPELLKRMPLLKSVPSLMVISPVPLG